MRGLGLLILVFLTMDAMSQVHATGATTTIDSLITLSERNKWKDPSIALFYADQAFVLASELNFPEGVARARNQKGFSYWTFGDNDLAIQEAMEALKLATRANQPLIEAESYYILARGYMDVGEQEKAWESIREAARRAEEGNQWELLCSIYNLQGVIQFIDQRQDSALVWYNRAFELGKAHNVDPIDFPRIISNIGECYAVENPALAFTYFTRALALADQTGNQIAKASITDIIGHASLRGNDLKSAERHLQEALRLARRLGLRRVVRHAYAGLVDIRLRQGRGDEAVVYLRKYYEVRDSLLSTSKVRQIVELEAKHALEMKEQNIRLLENEKRIQRTWNYLLIGLVVLITGLSAGLYSFQRFRYRKNRELLDLEIDYLTRRQKEAEERIKASLTVEPDDPVESQDQKVLRSAIATVEKHLGDPHFGVEELADAMHMSRASLHRKIKAITGFPASELIRSIRLRKAARLIRSKADTASQIAMHVGFDDYSHFSKSFKKYFGVSPTVYETQPSPPDGEAS